MTYLDYFVLDVIQHYHEFPDTILAKTLHCPRTVLLDRLERLIAAGYIVCNSNKYQLTDVGKSFWIPLYKPETDSQSPEEPSCQSFDWTELYIPPAGWQAK